MKIKKRDYIIISTGLILCACIVLITQKMAQDNYNILAKKTQGSQFNTLAWSDEFNGNGQINPDKWFHQTQLPPGGSWWGGLIQHYTDRKDNSYLSNGFLNIVAKKEKFDNQGEIKQYTSARLNSKFAFTYGRVEVRAELPTSKGTWPAIWMLNKKINEDGAYWDNQGYGTINWPTCGEIDILEHWRGNQNYVQSGVHNASSYGDEVVNINGQNVSNVSDQFHIYSIEWSHQKIIFMIDGSEHYVYEPSIKNLDTWPYDSEMYLLLNVAVEPDIDSSFVESSMVIDYIRVYE